MHPMRKFWFIVIQQKICMRYKQTQLKDYQLA